MVSTRVSFTPKRDDLTDIILSRQKLVSPKSENILSRTTLRDECTCCAVAAMANLRGSNKRVQWLSHRASDSLDLEMQPQKKEKKNAIDRKREYRGIEAREIQLGVFFDSTKHQSSLTRFQVATHPQTHTHTSQRRVKCCNCTDSVSFVNDRSSDSHTLCVSWYIVSVSLHSVGPLCNFCLIFCANTGQPYETTVSQAVYPTLA